jgi:hypothetical protein
MRSTACEAQSAEGDSSALPIPHSVFRTPH